MSRRLARLPRWALIAITLVLAGVAVLIVRHERRKPAPMRMIDDRIRLIDAEQTNLRHDPNIADLVYTPGRDQWDVTPANTTVDPVSFGRYVCFLLGNAGVAGTHTSVRVIDGATLQAKGFDYPAATRATVGCPPGVQ
jgi:hypothetical protein